MASVDRCEATLIDKLSRDVNLLKDDDRLVRKRSLETIGKETVKNYRQLSENDYHSFVDYAYKTLLLCLSDRVEKCREMAADILLSYMSTIPHPHDLLSYVIPVFVQRLSSPEIVEPSEEVRLIEVQTLGVIVKRCKEVLSIYLNELITILCQTVVDPYPEIKKESCSCIITLAEAASNFHMQAQSLVNPLLKTVSHQHAKVRTNCINALGTVVQFGNSKMLEDVIPHLAQRLFDQSPAVRLAVTNVVGQWLIKLPDRYSYFYKLIPLLLSSLTDSVYEVSEMSDKLWKNAGQQYIKENENNYKDQLDFPKPLPSHYPNNVIQPTLGCRILVQRHLSYILPAVLGDLEDWLPATRVKSVHLLYLLLLHCEEDITMNLQSSISGLVQAAVDEEKEVCTIVERSSELIGCFISPDVWGELILSAVSSKPCASTLRVLASIMKGTSADMLTSSLNSICSILAEPDVCRISEVSSCEQLLNCVETMLDTCGSSCVDVSFQLFTILVTVQAMMNENTEVTNRVLENLKKLSAAHSSSVQHIYDLHSRSLVETLHPNHHLWTSHSPQLAIFSTLLVNTQNIGEVADLVVPMIVTNLQPTVEPEMRLQLFILLSSIFNRVFKALPKQFLSYIPVLVEAAILPNLVWQAGRTAAALQSTAVSCLWTCVKHGYLSKDKIEPLASQLLTRLLSLLESDMVNTRLIACKVLAHIFPSLVETVDSKQIHNLYPDLLKCMDDVSNDVRIVITKIFLSYFRSFPKDFDWSQYKYHVQAIYSNLLLHMDDPQKCIQDAVFDVLKEISSAQPKLLLEEAETVQHKHRNPVYCTQLIKHIQDLLIED